MCVCVNLTGQNVSPSPPPLPALELRMLPQTGRTHLVQNRELNLDEHYSVEASLKRTTLS